MGVDLFADTKTIRAAIFDILDSRSNDEPWRFHEGNARGWSEDDANRERMRFVEAVIDRINDLQTAPFDGIKLQNLCDRHIRATLPSPRSSVCGQCEAEQKAQQGA